MLRVALVGCAKIAEQARPAKTAFRILKWLAFCERELLIAVSDVRRVLMT
jgi:hypothetical protein